MKFFRVLANALFSGLFFAILLSLLFADLNINQKISLSFLGELSLYLAFIYGLLAAIVLIIGFFIIQFLTGKKARIAVPSPSFLSLSLSVLILLFLLVFKVNTGYFFSFFDAGMRTHLMTQMWILVVIALLGPAAFALFHGVKKNPLFFWIYFIFLVSGVILTVSQRWRYPVSGPAESPSTLLGKRVEKRVTILGLEGLSFNVMVPLISGGRLPNFSWLINNGSSGRLVNFSPNEPITLNSSFNTGKFPAKHRQLSLFRYRLGKMKQHMEVVPRFILFKQLVRTGLLKISPSQPVSRTSDIWQICEGNRIAFIKKDWPYSLEAPPPSPRAEKLLANFFDHPGLAADQYFSLAKNAFFRDCHYEALAADERNQLQPQIFYLLLDGLNTVETYFYKYGYPQQFGSIDHESLDKYGSVINNYYEFYDDLIGKYLTGLKGDELLVVYSAHGIEPLPLWKRAVESLLGNPDVSAYHEFAPDGVVFFYGNGVVRGQNLEQVQIVDIAPTLLYYLGLPVGRDMDGTVRSSVFAEEFIDENPLIYIPSYEEVRILPPQ